MISSTDFLNPGTGFVNPGTGFVNRETLQELCCLPLKLGLAVHLCDLSEGGDGAVHVVVHVQPGGRSPLFPGGAGRRRGQEAGDTGGRPAGVLQTQVDQHGHLRSLQQILSQREGRAHRGVRRTFRIIDKARSKPICVSWLLYLKTFFKSQSFLGVDTTWNTVYTDV